MNETEFDSTIDAFAEIDPREYVKAGRREIDELERADIPEATFDMIAGPLRRSLAAKAELPIRRRDFDRLGALLTGYRSELRNRIAWERREGSLKPWSAEDVMKRAAHTLDQFAWHREGGMLLKILEEGDELGAIDFRRIEIYGADGTRKPGFERRDPRIGNFRPVSRSKDHWYAEWSTPESTIAEAEDAARREAEIAARPWHQQAGPAAGLQTVVQR